MFDHVGAVRSTLAAYDFGKYASLDGYVNDILDFFGERRLVALAGSLRDSGAATIADEVAAAAVAHQQGTPRDDIAIVVVRDAGFHGGIIRP